MVLSWQLEQKLFACIKLQTVHMFSHLLGRVFAAAAAIQLQDFGLVEIFEMLPKMLHVGFLHLKHASLEKSGEDLSALGAVLVGGG